MSLLDWIYLPKPRPHLKRFRTRRSRTGGSSTLYQRRRRTRSEHHRLFSFVLGLFMLVIAVRVGSTIALTMHHPLGFRAALYADGIHLPRSESGTGLSHHRFYLFITITEEGVVEFDGEQIMREHWHYHLTEAKSFQPKMRALLLVDRKCQMGPIEDVLKTLRDVGIREVVFATSRRDDTIL